MKRLAIFAHFDKKNVVDDYVFFYIEKLKKYCDKILFYSLSDLPEEEVKKLDKVEVVLTKHNEYDFGSYKRGYFYAKENGMFNDIDELLFINDSCYCIKELDEVFESPKATDFWGVIENKYGFKKVGRFCFSYPQAHLQSWFLGFKKNVFENENFEKFLLNIQPKLKKTDIILKYEIGLTQALKTAGFTYESVVNGFEKSYNPSVYNWRTLVENGLPFVKRSVLLGLNSDKTTIDGWKDVIKNEEAIKFIEKNNGSLKINTFLSLEKKLKMFKFLSNSPDLIRRISTKILKTFAPFVFD